MVPPGSVRGAMVGLLSGLDSEAAKTVNALISNVRRIHMGPNV